MSGGARAVVSERALHGAFLVLAIAFVTSAIFHVVAIVAPSVDPSAPTWRHALFAAINLGCAAGFAFRPAGKPARAFVAAFAFLVLQQLVSHGTTLWNEWSLAHRVDVNSVLVIVVMPLALGLLVHASTAANPGRRTP